MGSQSGLPAQFDVCMICALAEEAKAVIKEFKRLAGAQWQLVRRPTPAPTAAPLGNEKDAIQSG